MSAFRVSLGLVEGLVEFGLGFLMGLPGCGLFRVLSLSLRYFNVYLVVECFFGGWLRLSLILVYRLFNLLGTGFNSIYGELGMVWGSYGVSLSLGLF